MSCAFFFFLKKKKAKQKQNVQFITTTCLSFPSGCPLAERSEGMPCCCVSYATADSAEPVSTAVIANTDSPVWDHQHECRLNNFTDLNLNNLLIKHQANVFVSNFQAIKAAPG